jgi:hypothetical protein
MVATTHAARGSEGMRYWLLSSLAPRADAPLPAGSVGADTASERRTYQHRVGSASVRGH